MKYNGICMAETVDLWNCNAPLFQPHLNISHDNLSIFTIGYEGHKIEDFISKLKDYSISTIIDVREFPFSRKKGFSKASLRETLLESGIDYVHLKNLGSPKAIRDQLHTDNNYDLFFSLYENYLEGQTSLLDSLSDTIENNFESRYCLLCFEKNPYECHRKVIADRLCKANNHMTTVVNL